jgi:hypothetical protein
MRYTLFSLSAFVLLLLPTLSLTRPVNTTLTPIPAVLHIDYLTTFGLYYSTSRFVCKPAAVAVAGSAFPLVVEAVDGTIYDQDNLTALDDVEAAYTVAVVALSQVVFWEVPQGRNESSVVLRVTDADGRRSYTGREYVHKGSIYAPMRSC